MRKNLLAILAILAIGYTGCKQNAYKAPAPLSADSFFPQTDGSTWTYRDSLFGEPTDTAVGIYGVKNDIVTYTMNGATTDWNNQVCFNATEVSQLFGTSTAYFWAKEPDYALMETSKPFGFTNISFLVDTGAVGYTWSYVPSLTQVLHGSPVICQNKILEKDIIRVINGKTFTNVIHTGINYQINIDGTGFNNIAYFDFYIAKGIGIVEKDSYYYGDLNETETIMSYSIK